MDRQGHERIQAVAAEAGAYVRDWEPGRIAARYVTAQVTGQPHAEILNALHDAGLMRGSKGDMAYESGPQLTIAASSNDWLTLEDLNHNIVD